LARPWNERWQTFVIAGAAMVAGGPYVLWYLAEWEADPAAGELSMRWPAGLVYRVGGKWLLSALVLGVGCVLLRVGLGRRRVQRPRRVTASDAEPLYGHDCQGRGP
jgi:hypothetical protein